jgi:hypothetical protein
MICPFCAGNPLSESEVKIMAEFIAEMETRVIPEIIAILRKRAAVANEQRGLLYAENRPA